MEPGAKVQISVWRKGESKTFDLTLGELPAPDKMASADQGGSSQPNATGSLADFGLTVTPSEDGKGLVVTDVDPSSDAADHGIQAGDVIVSVNSEAVNSAQDVDKAVKQATDAGRPAVLVQLQRDSVNRFVALPVGKG